MRVIPITVQYNTSPQGQHPTQEIVSPHNERIIDCNVLYVPVSPAAPRVWIDITALNLSSTYNTSTVQYLYFVDQCIHYIILVKPFQRTVPVQLTAFVPRGCFL